MARPVKDRTDADDLTDDLTALIRFSRLVPMNADHLIPQKARFMAELLVRKYKPTSCPSCNGEGVSSHIGAHDSGEHAAEERCPLCGGNGCGDCATVSEDDERGPRGLR